MKNNIFEEGFFILLIGLIGGIIGAWFNELISSFSWCAFFWFSVGLLSLYLVLVMTLNYFRGRKKWEITF